jgi:methanol metabolism-related c-type cytochrome
LKLSVAFGLAFAASLCLSQAAKADGSGDSAAVKETGGEYFDKAGNPTFKIGPDGAVDWYTFEGYLRYNSMCIVCHGPDGSGSSYAPDLTNSLKSLNYGEFLSIVAAGKKDVSAASDLVMPAFGNNKNVVCYLDDIFAYLRARSDGAVGRGRPEKHAPKPEAFTKAEDQCMGP